MNGVCIDHSVSRLDPDGLRGGPDYQHLLVKALSQYDTPTLIDHNTESLNTLAEADYLQNLAACEPELARIYSNCVRTYPDFEVSLSDFSEAVIRAVDKYLIKFGVRDRIPTAREISRFINDLQSLDLYLAQACARGNEQAWWEFDRNYRRFIERVARHLVGTGVDADEAIDFVYAELFGTNTASGTRQSKFKTYSGRGTLRGWLRAVIWHAIVDLYRGRADEIPLDQCSELNDEPREMRIGAAPAHAAEDAMLETVVRERYRSATLAALDHSLAKLEPHETLLLMYYHIEGLKLREIARIIENPTSPMRRWFKRPASENNSKKRSDRIHESTIMRWLEKAYRKVLQAFHAELQNRHGLKQPEIELCIAIAAEDLGQTVRLDARGPGPRKREARPDAKSKAERMSQTK